MTPPRFCRRTRAGCSLILSSWWNKLFKTQEQGLREKLSPPSLSLLFEYIKITIRANMAKLHIKFLLFFTLQALRSGLAGPLQSIQRAARLKITAAMTVSSCSKTHVWSVSGLASASVARLLGFRALHFYLLCLLQDIACSCVPCLKVCTNITGIGGQLKSGGRKGSWLEEEDSKIIDSENKD